MLNKKRTDRRDLRRKAGLNHALEDFAKPLFAPALYPSVSGRLADEVKL
jgi:hypothetical protein